MTCLPLWIRKLYMRKGLNMYNLLPTEEYEWLENDNGNFLAISAGGNHEATVFKNGYEWKIIINCEDAVGRIVADETFDDPYDAKERTEGILRGAKCTLVFIKPKDASTGWKTQKTVANGSPTYGRKYKGMGVSVKKATSGSWFYITYSGSDYSQPQGWYGSAGECMEAFDALHP